MVTIKQKDLAITRITIKVKTADHITSKPKKLTTNPLKKTTQQKLGTVQMSGLTFHRETHIKQKLHLCRHTGNQLSQEGSSKYPGL